MLDMRTFVFSNVLTDIVCLVVIVLLWQQTRRRFAGTVFFVFDFALQTTALFPIILRGQIPDWMSFVLANTLVMAGALLGYMGLTRFVGEKRSQIFNYVLLVAFAAVHTYFTFVQSDQAVRNLNVSIVLLIICLQCAWLMLGRVEPGMRQMTKVVGIVFAAYCVISVIRIVEFFSGSHSTGNYLQSGTFEQIVLLSNQILFILLTYGLALMFNKRLLLDIATQEEKFSKAFHSSPYAVTITRMSDGQIIEVNEGFFKITGYQLADVKGNTTIGMHLWDREENRALIISELSSKGNVHGREFQFRKKSGEIITGLFSAEIITINNEKHVLSSINDITSIKQAEEVLRASEAKFSKTFDTNPVATAISILQDGRFLNVNDAMLEVFSFSSKAELIGKTSLELGLFADPHDRQIIRKAIEETGRVHNIELKMVTKDDRVLDCLFSAEPVLVSNEHCLLTTAVDITSLKKAEEMLRQSEERYYRLIVNLDVGIVVHAPDTSIILSSARASELLGLSNDQMKGKMAIDPAWRFVKKDNTPLHFDDYPVNQIVNGRIEIKNQTLGIYQPGKKDIVWINVNGFPVLNNKGEIIEVVISFIDITESRRAQEEIIRLNVELEKKVLSRTSDLRNSQLALLSIVEDLNVSQKKIALINQSLDATNKEIESFSYSVSHDLRAPLRSIDGFSQALLDDYSKNLDDTGRNYLERIRKAAQNMSMLIDDMLKLSRVNKAEFRIESVNASKMFQDIIRNFRQNNPARKVKVIIQKDLIITADSRMLEIVMTNLIDNAWKFTGKTENARIELGMMLADGKPVIFIRDNGVGFDMSYANKLFGTFQRLHTKFEFVGTGIGLAIVKRIIARHGGEVWAEAEVGKGAVFYFTLP